MLLCREYIILLLYDVIELYGLEEVLGLGLHLDSIKIREKIYSIMKNN
jgi:hypothetical protein